MRVLTIGMVEKSKRPADFVEIAAKVSRRLAGVEFVWVGNGSLREKMIEKTRSQALSNVKFPGRLDAAAAGALMQDSSVYVSTSESEGFALTPGEALLKGLPVVVYDLPIYLEVYDHFLVTATPFDLDDFAEKVLLALSKPDWLARQIQAGAEHVRSAYSVTAVGNRAASALRRILDREN